MAYTQKLAHLFFADSQYFSYAMVCCNWDWTEKLVEPWLRWLYVFLDARISPLAFEPPIVSTEPSSTTGWTARLWSACPLTPFPGLAALRAGSRNNAQNPARRYRETMQAFLKLKTYPLKYGNRKLKLIRSPKFIHWVLRHWWYGRPCPLWSVRVRETAEGSTAGSSARITVHGGKKAEWTQQAGNFRWLMIEASPWKLLIIPNHDLFRGADDPADQCVFDQYCGLRVE